MNAEIEVFDTCVRNFLSSWAWVVILVDYQRRLTTGSWGGVVILLQNIVIW